MDERVSFDHTIEVRDTCLCLHMQRAARALARRFDVALRPAGLTNEQFSLLMSLNRPAPPRLGEVSVLLGTDRTTLTAALKPLVRRELVEIVSDAKDARVRRLVLTNTGHAALLAALPIWIAVHAAVESELHDPDRLRRDLDALAGRAPAPVPTGNGKSGSAVRGKADCGVGA
jgi:DNA-binding MarR family transcriptional regulator